MLKKKLSHLGKTSLLRNSLFAMLFIANSALAASIENPIKANDFPTLIQRIAEAVGKIGAIFAVVAIIFVGFQFLTGSIAGDEKKIGQAKRSFFWVIIGTAIVVGASVLARVAVDIVKNL